MFKYAARAVDQWLGYGFAIESGDGDTGQETPVFVRLRYLEWFNVCNNTEERS